MSAPSLPPKIRTQVADVVSRHAGKLGLIVVLHAAFGGMHVLPDGRAMPRIYDWCFVDANELAILRMAVTLTERIAEQHGPGRVWSLSKLGPVHLVNDDGTMVYLHPDGHRPVCRMRRLYYHEATAR